MTNWTRAEKRNYTPIQSLELEALYTRQGLPASDPKSRQKYLQTFAQVPDSRSSEFLIHSLRGRRDQALNMLETAALEDLRRLGSQTTSCDLFVALYRNNKDHVQSLVGKLAEDVQDLQRVRRYEKQQCYAA